MLIWLWPQVNAKLLTKCEIRPLDIGGNKVIIKLNFVVCILCGLSIRISGSIGQIHAEEVSSSCSVS